MNIARFNKQIDVTDITAIKTAEEQQIKFIDMLTTTLRDIADQKKEIQELSEDVKELKKYIKNNRLSWW